MRPSEMFCRDHDGVFETVTKLAADRSRQSFSMLGLFSITSAPPSLAWLGRLGVSSTLLAYHYCLQVVAYRRL